MKIITISQEIPLTINTTGWNIKDLTPAAVAFAQRWLGRTT